MYIIQKMAGLLPRYHKIGIISLDGEQISVQVTTTTDDVGPGGVPFFGGGSQTLPSGTIDIDSVSPRTVAEWLVGPNGYYAGSDLVADADFPFASRVAVMQSKALSRRNATRNGGCRVTVRGETFTIATDPDSLINISGSVQMAVLALQSGETFTTTWRMLDDSMVALDALEMIAVGKTVGAFTGACQFRKNDLDALISALTADATDEEIDAVAAQIEEGWPS